MKTLCLLVLLAFFLACVTVAPAGAEGKTNPSEAKILKLLKAAGPLIYPIFLCSLLSVAVILERILALRRRKVIPDSLVGELQTCWQRGDTGAVMPLCQQNEAPLARILEAGFRRLGHGLSEMERAIEAAGQHEVSLLNANLRVLGAIGAIAPMIGLLGTVTGMISAFGQISKSAARNPELVAEGISQALTTTAAGLIVAIPSLAAYHFFRSRIDRLVYDMEEIATNLLIDVPEEMSVPLGDKGSRDIS